MPHRKRSIKIFQIKWPRNLTPKPISSSRWFMGISRQILWCFSHFLIHKPYRSCSNEILICLTRLTLRTSSIYITMVVSIWMKFRCRWLCCRPKVSSSTPQLLWTNSRIPSRPWNSTRSSLLLPTMNLQESLILITSPMSRFQSSNVEAFMSASRTSSSHNRRATTYKLLRSSQNQVSPPPTDTPSRTKTSQNLKREASLHWWIRAFMKRWQEARISLPILNPRFITRKLSWVLQQLPKYRRLKLPSKNLASQRKRPSKTRLLILKLIYLTMGIDKRRFVWEPSQKLWCFVCSDVIEDPLQCNTCGV